MKHLVLLLQLCLFTVALESVVSFVPIPHENYFQTEKLPASETTERNLDKRQTSKCPTPTTMVLDEVYATTPGWPIGCAQWILKLTNTDRMSDLLYTNLNGTNATTSNPVFRLIPPGGYAGLQNSNIPDFAWSSFESTFQIPSCGLYENTYYITLLNAVTAPPFEFTMSLTQPIPTINLAPGATSFSGSIIPNEFTIFRLNVPNPAKAYQIFTQFKSVSSTIQILISADSCPTAARNEFAAAIQNGRTYLPIETRNLEPNTVFYFMLLPSNIYTVNVSLNFTYTPVTCSVPTDSAPCPTVSWPTPPVSESERSALATQLAVLATGNEGPCFNDQVDILCASLFYNCDSNGFLRKSCQADCQTYNKDCNRVNDCTTPDTSNNFCYIGAFGSSASAVSMSVLSVLAFVIVALSF